MRPPAIQNYGVRNSALTGWLIGLAVLRLSILLICGRPSVHRCVSHQYQKSIMQHCVCTRFNTEPVPPVPTHKVGIALQTLGLVPLNAMRVIPANGTCGWYIWGGTETSDEADFYQPLCTSHLHKYAPALLPYINLGPGWRVLLAPGYEDVWFDERLVETDG